MSPDPIVLPGPPRAATLFEGDLSAWLERELERAEERGAQQAGAIMDAAAARLDADRERAVEDLAAFATRFAAELSKHLLRIEIQAERHDIQTMVRETLARSGVGRGACVVHLSPVDAERLASVPFRSDTTIEADPTVLPGSIQVTTPQGLLVRDVEECIRHAADNVHAHMRGGKEPSADTADLEVPDEDPQA